MLSFRTYSASPVIISRRSIIDSVGSMPLTLGSRRRALAERRTTQHRSDQNRPHENNLIAPVVAARKGASWAVANLVAIQQNERSERNAAAR